MKQFIDKLIERLEEESRNAQDNMVKSTSNSMANFCSGACGAYNKTIAIVNQLVEEHKDDIQTIDVSELLGEQVNDGWIACSERLPDDFMSMEYLTTVKGRFYSEINYYCVVNHKWYSNERTTKEVNVIAWMPKPTVYQPKGQAND